MADAVNVEGICLRRVPVSEHDGVVTFLTRELGKVAVMVRGLVGPRSKYAATCQMFVRSRLQITPGRRLPLLTQTDLLTSYYELRGDLLRAAWATYVCELLDLALPDHEPNEDLYELLAGTLAALLDAADPAAPGHGFELRLLAELGYLPVLEHCAISGQPLTGETAWFCPAAGGLVTPGLTTEAGVEVTPRTVAAMRRLLDPDAYGIELATIRIPPAIARPLRQALRAYLAWYLEAEPKSAAFLEQVSD